MGESLKDQSKLGGIHEYLRPEFEPLSAWVRPLVPMTAPNNLPNGGHTPARHGGTCLSAQYLGGRDERIENLGQPGLHSKILS